MSKAPELKMTVQEALEFADEWSKGLTLHEDSSGWRVVCMMLAEEVRRLAAAEKELNAIKAAGPVAWRSWDDENSRWDLTLWPDEWAGNPNVWTPLYAIKESK